MIDAYTSAFKWPIFIAVLLLFFSVCLDFTAYGTFSPLPSALLAVAVSALLIERTAFRRLSRTAHERISTIAEQQAELLDRLPPWSTALAIVGTAGISLLLELVIIRWHGTIFPVFAQYKNLSLIACFIGLGLGYALARSKHIPLVFTLPVLALQIVLFTVLRYGTEIAHKFGLVNPVVETTSMGLIQMPDDGMQIAALGYIYLLLALTFLTTALAFVPVGQACGRVLVHKPNLTAYGLNLVGSILGTLGFILLSFLWTGPPIWFVVTGILLLTFQQFSQSTRLTGLASLGVLVVGLAWPVQPTINMVYSPYQLVEAGTNATGHMAVLSNGRFFQMAFDFAPDHYTLNSPGLKEARNYYEFPFKISRNKSNIAIVGAGSGNDVAAALRLGAQQVDAIEIDPVILELGNAHHPEHPYHDGRVNRVVQDARTHFRTTKKTYDTIVFGALDAQSTLGQSSNVRLDSFVYTVESFKEAYGKLRDGGVLSVSFMLLSPVQGERIHAMLARAAGGIKPVSVQFTNLGGKTVLFIVGKNWDVTGTVMQALDIGLEDASTKFGNGDKVYDLPTDDWPFFYMEKRIYPMSYVVVLGLVVLLTVWLSRRLIPVSGRPTPEYLAFLALGAGFMLVETKAITELGLVFGNTWHVIGLAITFIIGMAYVANLMVARFRITSNAWAYVGLFSVILLGYGVSGERLDMDYDLYRIVILLLLTAPMFFSGIIFSTSINRGDIEMPKVMAYNIVGASLGGVLEYNAMYFGFSFLYLLALGVYVLAFILGLRKFRRAT